MMAAASSKLPSGYVSVSWNPGKIDVRFEETPDVYLLADKVDCVFRDGRRVPAWRVNGTYFLFPQLDWEASDFKQLSLIKKSDPVHLFLLYEWGRFEPFQLGTLSGNVVVLNRLKRGCRGSEIVSSGGILDIGGQIPQSPLVITLKADRGYFRCDVDQSIAALARTIFLDLLKTRGEEITLEVDRFMFALAICYHALNTLDGSREEKQYRLTNMLDYFGIPHTTSPELRKSFEKGDGAEAEAKKGDGQAE